MSKQRASLEKLSDRLNAFEHFYHEDVQFESLVVSRSGLMIPSCEKASLYMVEAGEIRASGSTLAGNMSLHAFDVAAFRVGQDHTLKARKCNAAKVFRGQVSTSRLSAVSSYPPFLVFPANKNDPIHTRLYQIISIIREECSSPKPEKITKKTPRRSLIHRDRASQFPTARA